MVRKRAGRPGKPADYPPYPAAGASNHSPSPQSPKITVQTNALAGGDTTTSVAVSPNDIPVLAQTHREDARPPKGESVKIPANSRRQPHNLDGVVDILGRP